MAGGRGRACGLGWRRGRVRRGRKCWGKRDEENSKEGSTTETFEEAARRVVRRDAVGGGVRNMADAAGAFARDALRGGKYFGAAASSAETTIRRVCGGETAAGSGGSFVWGGARAGVGIPAESCGEARCWFRDRAEGWGADWYCRCGLLN